MLYSFANVHFFFLFFFFFFSFFFHHDFVRPISLEPLLAETPNWVCCLVLWYSCALLFTLQFASLFYFYFFFFAKILSGSYLWNHYSQKLQIECAAWFCGLVLHYCLPSNSLRFFFFFFFFCHDFVRAISLEPLLAETPNWVCCLVLRSNFALLLTIQFASLLDQSSGDRSSVAYRATENLSRFNIKLQFYFVLKITVIILIMQFYFIFKIKVIILNLQVFMIRVIILFI